MRRLMLVAAPFLAGGLSLALWAQEPQGVVPAVIESADRSQSLPPGVQPATEARRIVRRPGSANGALPPPARGSGHWPSFRGHEAAGSAERTEPA